MTTMKFAHIEYSIQTKSIDIFNVGCDGFCKNCCNPEIKDWNLPGQSPEFVLTKVGELISKFNSLIDRIILVGGDPVDCYKHYPEYLDFIIELKKYNKPIYLFTRHELDEIPNELKNMVQYIKTGAYIPELTCDDNICEGIKLATSNQKIYKMGE